MWRMSESVPGSDAAAPTPITIRPAMSIDGLVATAASTEPAQKIPTPVSITRFRPSRSPSVPPVSMSAANASMYPSTIHCRPLTLVLSDVWMSASATLTIVLSRKVRKRIAQTAASAASRACRCRNSASELTRKTLRLAGGRSRAAQRDELAQARVADLPRAVLPHRRPVLLSERGPRDLDLVDDLRLVRALERHGGDRHAHLLGQRVVREAR